MVPKVGSGSYSLSVSRTRQLDVRSRMPAVNGIIRDKFWAYPRASIKINASSSIPAHPAPLSLSLSRYQKAVVLVSALDLSFVRSGLIVCEAIGVQLPTAVFPHIANLSSSLFLRRSCYTSDREWA